MYTLIETDGQPALAVYTTPCGKQFPIAMVTLNFDEPDLTFIHSLQEDGRLTAKQMQSILEVVKAKLDIEGDF